MYTPSVSPSIVPLQHTDAILDKCPMIGSEINVCSPVKPQNPAGPYTANATVSPHPITSRADLEHDINLTKIRYCVYRKEARCADHIRENGNT